MPSPPPLYGSDVITDLLAGAGIRHAAFNPGATFRGLHDSLVNHTLDGPAVVPCATEGISVAAAQGYAKVTGTPMAVLLHDIVGLQAASMAVYNAWCDRVPMLLLGGSGPMSKARRRPWIDWIHTASAQAELIRHAVKWDDQPHDLASVPESFARALQTATSAPAGPVYLCYDVSLQEDPVPDGFTAEGIERYPRPSSPAASSTDLDVVAAMLRTADRPVIVAGHCGEAPQAFARLIELAESLAAPVLDTGVRFAFPTNHDLNAAGLPELVAAADVLLALDVDDLRGGFPDAVGDGSRPGSARVVHATLGPLRARGWSHDYQALPPVAVQVTATADGVVEELLNRLRQQPPDSQSRDRRRRQVAADVRRARAQQRAAAATATAAEAVDRDRLLHEVGAALITEPDTTYVLANGTNERVEHRLWDMTQPRQYAGWHAGGGLGYGLGAAIGVALASDPGTVVVDVQADGDALFTPAALWTMARLGLPVLVVMHNNRQYGNSVGHAMEIAATRRRPVSRRHVGTSLDDPPVRFADLATGFGVWGTGPITDVSDLGEALAAALHVVRSGQPAVVDVVTPSR